MGLDFVHIGYQKTASSWLQRNGFFHPEIGLFPWWEYGDLMKDFVFLPDVADYSADFIARFQEPIERHRTGRIYGLSYERLCGEMILGYDARKLAHRLRDVFGPLKIIVVIRNQTSMLGSCYDQFVKIGGTCTFNRLLEDDFIGGWRFRSRFLYHELVAMYVELFGPQNVHVGIYEELRADPLVFFQKIWRFLGVSQIDLPPLGNSVNRSLSPVSRWMKKKINHLFYLPHNRTPIMNLPFKLHQFVRLTALEKWVDGAYYGLGGPKTDFMAGLDPAFRNELVDAYAASNQRLSAITGIDLGRYGYPLPGN